MNAQIKNLWVAALRSGEYSQCKGLLTDELEDGSTGYCCLGVLCDLYERETGDRTLTNPLNAQEYLPNEVAEWAELDSSNPLIGRTFASCWNDTGATFPEIADLIEKEERL